MAGFQFYSFPAGYRKKCSSELRNMYCAENGQMALPWKRISREYRMTWDEIFLLEQNIVSTVSKLV
jgi:hypothetical protein